MITLHKRTSQLLMFTVIVSIFMTSLALLPSQSVHAAPASYSAPCHNHGCDGQLPYSYRGNTGYPCAGVSGANWYVVASAPLIIQDGTGTQVGYVQVWYSGSCNVNWGRAVANDYQGITFHFPWSAKLYSSLRTYQSCDRHANECVNFDTTTSNDMIFQMNEIDELACFSITVAYGQATTATGNACQH